LIGGAWMTSYVAGGIASPALSAQARAWDGTTEIHAFLN
jgi:hypothetical protein